MRSRVIGRLFALFGLYAIVLAGLAMRFSGQQKTSGFNLSLVELGVVTVAFFAMAIWMVTRRPKQPLD